ncbi:hypothetical protein SCE1572_35995 [Sorangium cellulosum So0157-2]|uniref:Uncharacterized protein n=1 Tax=Sorangium cellulosum So0157-2 TaxID=1254432 RepID=S4Y3P2_SORCE|nr:hypothetical protein SCE1572_35995 [Sorangium cellulosum So0157-2]
MAFLASLIEAAHSTALAAANPDEALLDLASEHRVSRLTLQRHRKHARAGQVEQAEKSPDERTPLKPAPKRARVRPVEPAAVEADTAPPSDDAPGQILPESSLERVSLMADKALRNAIEAVAEPEVTPAGLREIQAESRQREALRAKLRCDAGKILPQHDPRRASCRAKRSRRPAGREDLRAEPLEHAHRRLRTVHRIRPARTLHAGNIVPGAPSHDTGVLTVVDAPRGASRARRRGVAGHRSRRIRPRTREVRVLHGTVIAPLRAAFVMDHRGPDHW